MAETPETPERRRRGSFGPTVLAGLLGAGLAAVAAGRDWATASVTSGVRATASTPRATAASPSASSRARERPFTTIT